MLNKKATWMKNLFINHGKINIGKIFWNCTITMHEPNIKKKIILKSKEQAAY